MNKGFILIELIIVVAILGITAVVIIRNLSNFSRYMEMSSSNQTSTNQTSVNQTIELIIDGECYHCTKVE